MSLRVEVGSRVLPVCLCFAQTVQVKCVLVVPLVSVLLLAAPFLCPVASLLLPAAHGPVCLSGRAKSAAPLLRPEPLDSRQLLAADFRQRERQHELVEECSWDSPS